MVHFPLRNRSRSALHRIPHGYARACRWQFQIFAGTWTKLSPLQSNEEDSCGGACCISFLPIVTHEMRVTNPGTETDISFYK
jgi:hypothetical protein